MAFQKGNKLSKGRPRGATNERTRRVEEIADKYALDPFEVLLMIASGDWKGLGYESATRTSFTNAGIEFEEPVIKISDRGNAAKEAARYLYSQKQAVSIDINKLHKMTDDEFEAFKNKTIEDYLNNGK
jgi:hypothetical protein